MSPFTPFNRRKETTTTADTPAPTPLMQFLTLGGATVDLHPCQWTEHHLATEHRPAKALQKSGFGWVCRGCDTVGGGGRYGLGPKGYDESEPRESKRDANTHAATCRAMPRPADR